MSKFLRSRKKKGKWLALGALATALAIAIGIFAFLPGRGEAVNVYPFSYIGMTEYWGDSQESYGPVTTDKIQTVFLSETQTVTELLVQEGDQVKKGDLLMTFDTTLSELQLERKRLEMEKEKLQLEQENAKLEELFGTTPWEEPPPPPAPPAPSPGTARKDWKDQKYLFLDADRDGSAQEKAAVYWLETGQAIDDALFQKIRQGIQDFRDAQAQASNPSQVPEGEKKAGQSEGDGTLTCGCTGLPQCTAEKKNECEYCKQELGTCLGTPPAPPEPPACGCTGLPQCTAEQKNECEYCKQELGTCLGTPPAPPAPSPCSCTGLPQCTANQKNSCEACERDLSACEGTPPTPPACSCTGDSKCTADKQQECPVCKTDYTQCTVTEPSKPSTPVSTFYVIFRTSEGDMSNQEVLTWQGLQVQVLSSGFRFQFFPTYYMQDMDPFYVPQAPVEMPEIDVSVGYTKAELQKMIDAQRKAIKDQEFKFRLAENAYKIMEKELSDGNIYAEIDGSVVSLLDAEESKLNKQPIVKVSGGGSYVIKGSVSELEKDSLALGQEVTVNDWNTGGSYTGTIQEIGDFPSSGNGWSGMGNPTATFYPFTVSVDETADLQSGVYASIQYSSGTGSHGVYLEKPFIRTVDGESYVLVRNGTGRLEKRPVTLGKSLWGSYTEILSGITEEDFLAFPYGKEAKAGANTREGSLEELYNY